MGKTLRNEPGQLERVIATQGSRFDQLIRSGQQTAKVQDYRNIPQDFSPDSGAFKTSSFEVVMKWRGYRWLVNLSLERQKKKQKLLRSLNWKKMKVILIVPHSNPSELTLTSLWDKIHASQSFLSKFCLINLYTYIYFEPTNQEQVDAKKQALAIKLTNIRNRFDSNRPTRATRATATTAATVEILTILLQRLQSYKRFD